MDGFECTIRLTGVLLILLLSLSQFYCIIMNYFDITGDETCERISNWIKGLQSILRR
jgi:hypothetical protein